MKKLLLILMLVSVVFSQANHTGWPLELLSWNVDKAYPGIEYNYRLGIKGGEYPYRFYLRHGPSEMTIDTVTGEIKWTPSGATVDSVRVTVKDTRSDSLVVKYNITATTSGFYFVDSANGNNANNGSEASPWLTMAYASATADSSSYVYIKKGTYSETFNMGADKCGRFFAYPGDNVTIIGAGTTTASFSPVGKNRIFQGFKFDGNGLRWIFSISGLGCKDMIFRKNEMYNVMDTTSMNPAFIFFWDQGTPYTNIVIQDNIFHGLVDKKIHHGASVTMYQVQNSLYEDNHVYDIDGRGVNEKVGGKRNTIRGNRIHDIEMYQAIVLNSNPNSDSTEVCFNHIYDCTAGGLMLGLNGQYVANIFVHHNTFNGSIVLANLVIAGVNSNNINIYKNILGRGLDYPYSLGGWPTLFKDKADIDSNIIYGRLDSTRVAGSGKTLSLSQWRDSSFDINSLYMQLTYDADSIPILSDSLLAIYGHLASGNFTESEPSPPVITVQPRDTTVNDGQSAPFTITATNATGYQWYGNGSLISGATDSIYSFTATIALNNSKIYCRVTNATDTVWSDTATLTVNAVPKTPANITVEPVSDTVTAGQSATFYVTASGPDLVYQWYRNDSLIAGATNDTFTYTARSQVGNYTDNIYCLLTTDTTISTDTVNLLVNGIVFRQSTDTLKLVCQNNQNVKSWQWYKNNVAISGATDSVLSVVVDSTSVIKSVYYCEISNGAENKKVGDWTIERKANSRTVSRKNRYK